ncbi:HAD family hydrolase [Nocardia transvalensis]|uniref:HAD family hydrolase n=1 Tax=Nocardia transvalensis TaxID=37333 RepID=UPI0018937981|nr:HAD family hydrolase [Nocardia transvalensis]MBF6331277.1 HAD family hydrolase [Nocardia transvalensis]
MIQAVVFDVGETLVDETRRFEQWADRIGVPRLTFMGTLGGVIAAGRDYSEVFQIFRPGFDLARESPLLDAAMGAAITEQDLYPDVRQALSALRELGVWVGIVGNQPARTTGLLRDLDLPTDYISTSADWGARKPDPEFFDKVAATAPCAREHILYVGDRVDNDVVPSTAAGLRAAFLLRGPWAFIHRDSPGADHADWRISGLDELPALVAAENA